MSRVDDSKMHVYERSRIADYVIGLRIALRSAIPDDPVAQRQRSALTQQRLALMLVTDLAEIERVIVWHGQLYDEEKQRYRNTIK